MLQILFFLLALLSSAGVALAGGISFGNLPVSWTAWLFWVSGSIVFLVVLGMANYLGSRWLLRKYNTGNVEKNTHFLLKHREDAEKTAASKMRVLKRIRLLSRFHVFLVFLMGAALAWIAGWGCVFFGRAWLVPLLVSFLLFYIFFHRVLTRVPHINKQTPDRLSEQEYPALYAVARRAADEMGCAGEIVICVSPDLLSNAAIAKEKRCYLLQFGAIMLNVWSEDELYHICLHEFSHYSAEMRGANREASYQTWLSAYHDSVHNDQHNILLGRLMSFLTSVYIFPDVLYTIQHALYSYAASVIKEIRADSAMATHGRAEVAASALLKLEYVDKWMWEDEFAEEAPAYEPEAMPENFLHKTLDKLLTATEQRKEVWNQYIAKEIISVQASHPTFVMRMENLGVKELRLCSGNTSEPYREECQKALQFIEKLIYDDLQHDYAKEREARYLTPKKEMEEWVEQGKPLVAEEYADRIQTLLGLGRIREAEELCDRAIAELNEMTAAFALFMKGKLLLHRYHKEGMDLIYRAIDINANFAEEGLELIGRFCCMTGEAELLADYRARAVAIMQKQLDENEQVGFLSKKDHLSKDDMPQEMLEKILSFMLSVGEDIIDEIYLVRKTVSETFFSSVFVVRFYGGNNQQQQEILHKIFRFLDSYPEERQFSLFDYFEYPDIRWDKIEGSLVYSKRQAKQD